MQIKNPLFSLFGVWCIAHDIFCLFPSNCTCLTIEQEDGCKHKALLGQGNPLDVLNMEDPPEPQCWDEDLDSVIITTTSNTFWGFYTTEEHDHITSPLEASYLAFTGTYRRCLVDRTRCLFSVAIVDQNKCKMLMFQRVSSSYFQLVPI